MQLNEIGKTANDNLRDIPNHFKNVRLGAQVVMPNHVHVILIIDHIDATAVVVVGTLHCNVPTIIPTPNKNQFMSDISPKPGSVSTIIRSYKSACTKWINQHYPGIGFGWQPRFHDHIIRNEQEYQRI